MDRNSLVLGAALLLILSLPGVSSCVDPASAYKFTSIACRLMYPAAVVSNCSPQLFQCSPDERLFNLHEHIRKFTIFKDRVKKLLKTVSKIQELRIQDSLEKNNNQKALVVSALGAGIASAETFVLLNEKTTDIIQAAFQNTKYPSVGGEKSFSFMGTLKYGLHNMEIFNLSIGRSDFELRENDGIRLTISKVSAVFKGTIKYEYGSAIFSVNQSVNFEVESEIDLFINTKLYCGKGKVAADTSDCYLTFHKLRLLLQGNREPGWLKRLFTDFISLTVKLIVKSQICKEINKVANILAEFIQDTAEHFLSDGEIFVDIGITSAPVITSNYIESYHKGLVTYKNNTSAINNSVFSPTQITESRSLYFWISDEALNPVIIAAYNDDRFICTISGTELTELFQAGLSTAPYEVVQKWLFSEETQLKAWSASVPYLRTTTQGTTVKATAAVKISSCKQDNTTLYFETEVEVLVNASYAEKKLILNALPVHILISRVNTSSIPPEMENSTNAFLHEAVEKIGIPKVVSYLQQELTALLDEQGVNMFDIINPEVIPQIGYVLVQMDFGFPHSLLVEFLKKTLE